MLFTDFKQAFHCLLWYNVDGTWQLCFATKVNEHLLFKTLSLYFLQSNTHCQNLKRFWYQIWIKAGMHIISTIVCTHLGLVNNKINQLITYNRILPNDWKTCLPQKRESPRSTLKRTVIDKAGDARKEWWEVQTLA